MLAKLELLLLVGLLALSAAACGEDRLTVPTPIPSQTIRTTIQLCPDPTSATRGIVCP